MSEWIPISERLPDVPNEYNVSVHCDTWEKDMAMCATWENTTVRGKDVSRWIWNGRIFPSYWKITAWMPLPEPYKEVENDNNK